MLPAGDAAVRLPWRHASWAANIDAVRHPRSTDERGLAPSAPFGFVPSGWKRQVKAADGNVDSVGYRLCLLDAMRIGIRRRDLFASPNLCFADPRISLLAGSA